MTASPGSVRLRRAYDDPTPDDGHRVLVDRIWPRALTRGNSDSTPGRATSVRARSCARGSGTTRHAGRSSSGATARSSPTADRAQALDALAERVRRGPLTLVYGARDTEHDQARGIADELRSRTIVVERS
jgi:uncharacterized protein YeaO (DUF488 family)